MGIRVWGISRAERNARTAGHVLRIAVSLTIAVACADGSGGGEADLSVGSVPAVTRSETAAIDVTELEHWEQNLEHLTRDGTVWWTSNAEYRSEDENMDAYLMRYTLIPGGLAMEGCLWGERAGQTVGPFWRFFGGFDPLTSKGLVYQASPSGIVGSGHWWSEGGNMSQLEQVFLYPDGTVTEVRHETRMPDANTDVGSSFDRVGGQWVPRRSYTWQRRAAGETPC